MSLPPVPDPRLVTAVFELAEAIKPFGVEARRLDPDGPQDPALGQIIAELAPRALPADLHWLWSNWDLGSFGELLDFPDICTPGAVLELWKIDENWPRALMFFAYQSHCSLGIEFERPGGGDAGRRGWIYYQDETDMVVYATSLATLFDVPLELVRAGHVEERGGFVMLSIHGGDLRTERLDADSIDANDRAPFDRWHKSTWPAHWQAFEGIDPSDAVLRGATHTIAEVTAARSTGEVAATIQGRYFRIAGSSDGVLVVVGDETAQLDVYIPSSVPSLNDSADNRYELDIVAGPTWSEESSLVDLDGTHATITSLALSGDVEAAGRAALPLSELLHGGHAVIATAVRAM